MRASYQQSDSPQTTEHMKKMAARFGIEMGAGWITETPKVRHLAIDRDAYNSFIFFMRYSDQWRYSASGAVLGLDIPSILSLIALEKSKRKSQKRLLDDVIAIASGVKEGLQEQDE